MGNEGSREVLEDANRHLQRRKRFYLTSLVISIVTMVGVGLYFLNDGVQDMSLFGQE